MDFFYARERTNNYRDIVDNLIWKEIDIQKFTLLDSIARVGDLETSFEQIKDDMCLLSERLKETQINVQWLMLGNMKEYQKYQNIRIVLDKMHAIKDVISIAENVENYIETKMYKEAVQNINNGLDIIDCKLSGIRCVGTIEQTLKESKSRIEKFLKNPEKFVFEMFNKIEWINDVLYDLKRTNLEKEFYENLAPIKGVFENMIGTNKMIPFIDKYKDCINAIKKEICYSCLPLEFLQKEEYIVLIMTKTLDIEKPLEQNTNLKSFIFKLNIKEFTTYFFNITNKFIEIEIRAFLIHKLYLQVKNDAKVNESDDLMISVLTLIEDTIIDYIILLLSYANFKNLTIEEYNEFEKQYFETIDTIQTISDNKFTKISKIKSTFFQMRFGVLYICGIDEMLKIIQIETFFALGNSTNIIQLISKILQLIDPNDLSYRTLKIQNKTLVYHGQKYPVIGSLDFAASVISSFLTGFSLKDSQITDMIFEKSMQVVNTWRERINTYYFINVMASEPPKDYVWKCVCIHQSIIFLNKIIELLNTAFMKNSIDLQRVTDDCNSELKNIRFQIIQLFKVVVRNYVNSKSKEMDGFVSSTKPLPAPPKGSKIDSKKKSLPPVPKQTQQQPSLKITDVVAYLQYQVNQPIIEYFNDTFQQEIFENEEIVISSIESDFTSSSDEPNFRTKICSDLAFIKEEVIENHKK
ncbi:Uncharacterized protein QTN25_002342 [Entamoeba marina]